MTLERSFPFERVYNFRDLGGYPTADGRAVRWRRLFRSGELQRMSAEEVARTRDALGIATVIDFRSAEEADDPRGLGGLCEPPTQRHHFPLGNARSKYDARESGRWEPAYVAMLEDHGPVWADAVHVLAREQSYPALFHCVTGKDRTGVLAALVLDALGVDEGTILADYAESRRAMDQLIDRLRASGAVGPDRPPNPALGVVPAAMAEMLAVLRERHGSARGYLRAHGVSARTLAALEAQLLEEPRV